jgi:hypothetical protein
MFSRFLTHGVESTNHYCEERLFPHAFQAPIAPTSSSHQLTWVALRSPRGWSQQFRGSKWYGPWAFTNIGRYRQPLIPGRLDLGGRRRTSADKLLLSLLLSAGEGA